MPCKKCSKPIDGTPDTFTICRGKCSKAFHSHCVNLTADIVRALRCSNVVWLCDSCLVLFGSIRYREENDYAEQPKPPQIVEDVKELKAQVAEIIGLLSEGKPKPAESICLRQHSTPVSSKCSTSTTMPSPPSRCESFPTAIEEHRTSSFNGRRTFSLMLSNISSHVTEREIDSLVSESLGIDQSDNFEVVKLVPKWKVCEQIDYISFKVTLDEKWKNAALGASTWPPEIKYRKFISRRPVTWSPT